MELREGQLVRITDIPDYCKDTDGSPMEGAPVNLVGKVCVVYDAWKEDGMVLISDNFKNPEEGSFAYHPNKLELVGGDNVQEQN